MLKIEIMVVFNKSNIEEMEPHVLWRPKMFKRKAFEKLMYWKEKKAPKYSVLLEGAKGVKSLEK